MLPDRTPSVPSLRENDQGAELVELGGGDADLRLGVLKAEQDLAAAAVIEVLAVARLDLVELHSSVG